MENDDSKEVSHGHERRAQLPVLTSPDGPVQPAEIFADILPASGAEVIRMASLLCR